MRSKVYLLTLSSILCPLHAIPLLLQKMWRDDRKGYEEVVRRSVREQLGL
jgi:hypothetical protein